MSGNSNLKSLIPLRTLASSAVSLSEIRIHRGGRGYAENAHKIISVMVFNV